jgi:hypothetical protein
MKSPKFDTLVFDTLACKNRLMSKGLSEPHAEAITEEIKQTHEINLQNLATKVDLLLTKNDLMVEIKEVKNEINFVKNGLIAEMKQLELRMTIKLGGMLIIIAGLTLTVAKFMFGNA